MSFKFSEIKPVWKWTGMIVLVLILIVSGFVLYLDARLQPVAEKRIREAVRSSTDSLYTVDFADIHLNVFTGSVEIEKIVFKPDMDVFKRLKQHLKAPKHLFWIEVDELALNHIHPFRIYFRQELKMSSIGINKPGIKILYEDVPREDSLENDTRTAYQRLKKYLRSVEIGNISFKDADFQYVDQSGEREKTYRIQNFSINISDILIDSLSQYDRSRFYYTKDISVRIPGHAFTTTDKMYTIRVQDFNASTREKYIKAKGLRVIPRYPEMTFSRKYKYQQDRYSVNVGEIVLRNIDFRKFNVQRKLYASGIELKDADISIFRNKALPQPPIDKGRNFPHIALNRLKLDVDIDTLKITNANVSYSEFNPGSGQKGTVTFKDLHGKLFHVTNDSSGLAKNKWCRAYLSALLMGSADLNVNLNFNLVNANAPFSFSGTLGKFSLKVLNPAIRPLALVQVKSGDVQKMEFSADGNYRTVSGGLKLYYNDLRVKLLKTEGNKIKKKGVISFFANMLVVKNDNPEKDEPFRTARIYYTRPDTSSFFNLMWKGIFNGVKETVGLNSEKAETVKKQMNTIKKAADFLSGDDDKKKRKQ